MAKSPNKPIKKAQPKAKSASTGKPAKTAKPVKSAPKVIASPKAKTKAAKSALPAAKAKPLTAKTKATAKVIAAPAKKAVKPVKVVKPVAKSAPKAAPKAVAKKVAIKSVKAAKANQKIAKVIAAKPVSRKPAAVKAAPVKKVAAKAVPKPAKPAKPLKTVAAKPLAVKVLEKKTPDKKLEKKLDKKVAVKAAPVKAPKVKEPAKPEVVASPAPKVGKGVHASSKALARTLAQLPPPPPPPPMLPPEPPRRTVSPAALKAFDQAVKVFNRQNYEDAKALFENLEHKFPLDGELIGRAQVYIQACVKKLATIAPTRTISPDEYYDQGVHALNNGDYVSAKQFFEKALNLNPNEPDFLYSLAATHAQTGALDQALDFLRRSIEIKPRFRSQAFDDIDFSGLRDNRQFQELLGLTSPFERLEHRR